MAYKKRSYGKKRSSSRKTTRVEQIANLMGQVERGLKNPDSRITASYQRGLSEPKPRKRKSLF